MEWWVWLIIVIALVTIVPFLLSYYTRIIARSYFKGVRDAKGDADGECSNGS